MTADEQSLYFFAFRYALPRQSYAMSLVSSLVMQRLFRDRLQDALSGRSAEAAG